jgi:hypothetical protein
MFDRGKSGQNEPHGLPPTARRPATGAITTLGVAVGWGAGAWVGGGVTRVHRDYFRFPFPAYLADPASFALGAITGFAAAAFGTVRDGTRVNARTTTWTRLTRTRPGRSAAGVR